MWKFPSVFKFPILVNSARRSLGQTWTNTTATIDKISNNFKTSVQWHLQTSLWSTWANILYRIKQLYSLCNRRNLESRNPNDGYEKIQLGHYICQRNTTARPSTAPATIYLWRVSPRSKDRPPCASRPRTRHIISTSVAWLRYNYNIWNYILVSDLKDTIYFGYILLIYLVILILFWFFCPYRDWYIYIYILFFGTWTPYSFFFVW